MKQICCSWTQLGAPPTDPYYRLTLHALAMYVHPTFFDPVMPLCIHHAVFIIYDQQRFALMTC